MGVQRFHLKRNLKFQAPPQGADYPRMGYNEGVQVLPSPGICPFPGVAVFPQAAAFPHLLLPRLSVPFPGGHGTLPRKSGWLGLAWCLHTPVSMEKGTVSTAKAC